MKNEKKEAFLGEINKKIVNMTMHPASPEQGCFEPQNKAEVKELLLFKEMPTADEIQQRALMLANIAHGSGATHAMIGGALYLMSHLERALMDLGITPLYAFSERVSIETTLPNGEVEKKAVFKHLGFIEVFSD